MIITIPITRSQRLSIHWALEGVNWAGALRIKSKKVDVYTTSSNWREVVETIYERLVYDFPTAEIRPNRRTGRPTTPTKSQINAVEDFLDELEYTLDEYDYGIEWREGTPRIYSYDEFPDWW